MTIMILGLRLLIPRGAIVVCGLFTALALVQTLPAATFTVLNTGATGPGSLQQAIFDANTNDGPDTIEFNIPGTGPHVISPASALPAITDSVEINGFTQPGASANTLTNGNDAILQIQLDGASAGAVADGFQIAANGCTVRGLSITRFDGGGMKIVNGVSNWVNGCFLGLAPDGATVQGNHGNGLLVRSSALQNLIGGNTAAARCIISGNGRGIYLDGTSENAVQGCFIGTDASGTLDRGNTNSGIFIGQALASFNTIGGTTSAERNVISGNGEGFTSEGNGITLSQCRSNYVLGNYIGTTASGSAALGNKDDGVSFWDGASMNFIGGTTAGAGNVISANGIGINFSIHFPEQNGNLVQGNLIGTDASGLAALGNTSYGLSFAFASFNQIGGSAPGARNVISGNHASGLMINCCAAEGNVVQGNYLGVAADGFTALGNYGDGINAWSPGTQIGGTNSGEGNIIAFNGGRGVTVAVGAKHCPVLGNSIYWNLSLGLDLDANGVSANDEGDGDTGSNDNQNFPVLTCAAVYAGVTVIEGTLNSLPNGEYWLEFFDNSDAGRGGYSEGQTFLGSTNVTTDASGNAAFAFVYPAALALGHCVTATATDRSNNTSEFSACRLAAPHDTVDLSLVLTDSGDPVACATNFTYTLTINNGGPTNASGVFVTDVLPAGVRFVSATASQGTCSNDSGIVTCDLGSLEHGATATITIEVRATVSGSLSNYAFATAAELENNPADNSATEYTRAGIADLAVSTVSLPDSFAVGQTRTNIVTVTNLGPDAATGTVLNYKPSHDSVVTLASVSKGSLSQAPGSITCQFDTIPVGGRVQLTVVSVPLVTSTMSDFASVSPAESDPVPGNNSYSTSTTVTEGAGVMQFDHARYSAGEGDGAVAVTVIRSGGAHGTVSVDFSTVSLTATSGSDFVGTNGTLTFAEGEITKTFLVAILNDTEQECNEEFAVALGRATGGAVTLGTTSATVQIFDQDLTSSGPIKGVSLAFAGPPPATGNEVSFDSVLSADGLRVGYSSFSSDLAGGDMNLESDVFVRDLATGSNLLVSVNVAGTGAGNGFSEVAGLSADGRYVVFFSYASDLVAGDANESCDIFLRDTAAGTTLLVSANSTGTGPGNRYSYAPKLTPDGRFVVFESVASDLVTNDLNGFGWDIFLRDRSNAVCELITVNAVGTGGAAGNSFNPVVSDEGRFVAFESYSQDFGPPDFNHSSDVYVRDRVAGSNLLCSPNLAGTDGGNKDSHHPLISADGRYVIFESTASDLVAGDTNNATDIFSFDVQTRTLQLVSANADGIPGNGFSYVSSITPDGRFVAFESTASDLVANDSNGVGRDVFVRDMWSNTTVLVSVTCSGAGSGNDESYLPAISADGRYVAFESFAGDLAGGDFSAHVENIFRRDLLTGITVLVSQNGALTGGGNDYSYYAHISANGGVISFESDAYDLITGDANTNTDIFAWTVALPVVPSVDLALAMSASTNLVVEGDIFTYTVTVTNHGNVEATAIAVINLLPGGVNFASASATQGSVTNEGGTVTASIGSLAAGAGVSLSISVTATAVGSITNTATATAIQSDATPENNNGSTVVTITPFPSPTLTVTRINTTQFLVSWPSSTPSPFALESTTNLKPIIVWSPATNPVSDNGSIKSILITRVPGEAMRFYRLRR